MGEMGELSSLESRYGAANYKPLPVILVRGEGVHVWDKDGRRYLDMMGAYSAVSFGHCHPSLVKAMTRQARQLDTVSRAYFTDRLGPFLARACALTGMDAALPANGGAEAVETALKAARKWAYKVKGVPAERAEIIAAEGNFHGRTIAIVGFSSVPQYRVDFGPFPAGFTLVPFGDVAALEAAITPCTAAFLIEPIQGEGGINVPPAGYLAEAARICRARNVLLLCDEIQTGLGRTGRLLACEHDGVRPDGVTLGKALGGGLIPVSLFLARREVMDVFEPGDHGSTFGGNPVACAAALAVLDTIEADGLLARAAATGQQLRDGISAVDHPLLTGVRGSGLWLGLTLDGPAANDVQTACRQAGFLVNAVQPDAVRLAPPLILTEAEAAAFCTALPGILAGAAAAAAVPQGA